MLSKQCETKTHTHIHTCNGLRFNHPALPRRTYFLASKPQDESPHPFADLNSSCAQTHTHTRTNNCEQK